MVKISSVVHQNDREDHGYPPRGCATSAAAAIGDRGRKTAKDENPTLQKFYYCHFFVLALNHLESLIPVGQHNSPCGLFLGKWNKVP